MAAQGMTRSHETKSSQEINSDPSDHVTKEMIYLNKRAHVPWIAHLNLCQEERMFTTKYKSNSPTLNKSILDIIQIITKAYQVTLFNQIKLICIISMSDHLPKPKRPGVCIMPNILIA